MVVGGLIFFRGSHVPGFLFYFLPGRRTWIKCVTPMAKAGDGRIGPIWAMAPMAPNEGGEAARRTWIKCVTPMAEAGDGRIVPM